MTLLDDLRTAAAPAIPKGLSPGIVYAGAGPVSITTPWVEEHLETPDDYEEFVAAMGVPLPPGKTLMLAEVKFNQAAWHRDPAAIGTKDSAYTAPMWLYKWNVVDKGAGSQIDPADLEPLLKEARRKAKAKPVKPKTNDVTMVINLADFQIGKDDILGGTAEALERSEVARLDIVARARRIKPNQIILVDNGDSTEGFNSAPGAERGNDLAETEAIRVWRRIFWSWIVCLADLGIPMTVISVPSNHCRVRRGKNYLSTPQDDWGLEVLSQVSDMASVNSERFGHVKFLQPAMHEEHVTLTLPGGVVQTFAHGDQAAKAAGLPGWVTKQGRRPVGQSDIVTVGHHHHFEAKAFGDKQTLFVCPTNDNGSGYYAAKAGEESRPGVLIYLVDADGWFDMHVSWTA